MSSVSETRSTSMITGDALSKLAGLGSAGLADAGKLDLSNSAGTFVDDLKKESILG